MTDRKKTKIITKAEQNSESNLRKKKWKEKKHLCENDRQDLNKQRELKKWWMKINKKRKKE